MNSIHFSNDGLYWLSILTLASVLVAAVVVLILSSKDDPELKALNEQADTWKAALADAKARRDTRDQHTFEKRLCETRTAILKRERDLNP